MPEEIISLGLRERPRTPDNPCAFRAADASLDKILQRHDTDPERSFHDLCGLSSPNRSAGMYPRYEEAL
ncbi:hypothetical protein [Nonomuraea sp. NPDC049480]|uniref:hypothetical protein n=1 Tax=Nonomuraea sp. NPDC049480 TaxID=3364353 RepID=UPI0037B999AC